MSFKTVLRDLLVGKMYGGPPNNQHSVQVTDYHEIKDELKYIHGYTAMFLNDAHEIWIDETFIEGNNQDSKWKISIPCEQF